MTETVSPAPRRRRPIRTLLLIIVGVVAVAWSARFVYRYFRFETTDDAYLTGHVHQVSAQVAGQVLKVLVQENQSVKAGEPLVQIDPLEFDIGAHKAEAALTQAQGAAEETKAGVEEANAKVAQAQARLLQAQARVAEARAQHQLAHANLARSEQLSSGEDRAVTPADLDTAKSADAATEASVGAAEAAVTAAQADVKAAQAEIGAVGGQVQAAEANVALAQAALADARRQLSYVVLTAPADGRIGNKNVEPGNRVQPGQTLMVQVEPEIWVEANFKETQLAKVRAGQPVDIDIDAIPGKTFTGKVTSFAPATGAQFALLPADNATGNFTKVVQRVPVRIELDPASVKGYEDRLSPGLSATVAVDLK